MKLGAAAQGLSRAKRVAALAGVVHERDGKREAPLEVAQVREQGRDLGRGVFVDAMKPDEGVEDEQHRAQAVDGGLQVRPVFGEVEAQAGRGNHGNGQLGERDPSSEADAIEARAYEVQRVLGRVEEDWPSTCGSESAQAGDAGSDGDQRVEREKALAALGLATNDADRFIGPEVLDEPAVLRRTERQIARAGDGQGRHRDRPARARGRSAGVWVKSSKKSFSSSWATSRSMPARSNSCAWAISVR